MTLIHADGFDGLNNTQDLYYRYGGTGMVIDAGRISGNSIQGNHYNDYFTRYLENDYDTIYVGFAIKIDDYTMGKYTIPIIMFHNINGDQCALDLHPTPVLYRGSTMVQTGTTHGISANNWHYIEVKATINNSISANDFIVRIDGYEALNVNAGSDTQNLSSSGINMVRFYSPGSIWGNSVVRYDDLYILNTSGTKNNDFLGDVRITPIFPNADNTVDFASSDGTSANYEMVNDATNDEDTTYVESNTVGDIDLYDYESMPTTPYGVHGLNMWSRLTKNSAGDRTVKTICQSDGTVGESIEMYPNSSYIDRHTVLEDDPATGAAWTESGVNAAQFGIKVES